MPDETTKTNEAAKSSAPERSDSKPKRSKKKRRARASETSKRVAKKVPATNIAPTYGDSTPETRPLSVKQQRFVDARLEGLSLAESARKAGYTGNPRSLESTGGRLLRNAGVRAAIEAGQREQVTRAVLSRTQLREFWSRVITGEEQEAHYVVDRDTGESHVEHGPASMRDRLKASELLGKSRGMFIEKHEHKVGADTLIALVDAVGGKS